MPQVPSSPWAKITGLQSQPPHQAPGTSARRSCAHGPARSGETWLFAEFSAYTRAAATLAHARGRRLALCRAARTDQDGRCGCSASAPLSVSPKSSWALTSSLVLFLPDMEALRASPRSPPFWVAFGKSRPPSRPRNPGQDCVCPRMQGFPSPRPADWPGPRSRHPRPVLCAARPLCSKAFVWSRLPTPCHLRPRSSL